MSIPVICDHCQATFKVKDSFAGKRGKCPKCKNSIIVPSADDDDEVVQLAAAPQNKNPADQSTESAGLTLDTDAGDDWIPTITPVKAPSDQNAATGPIDRTIPGTVPGETAAASPSATKPTVVPDQPVANVVPVQPTPVHATPVPAVATPATPVQATAVPTPAAPVQATPVPAVPTPATPVQATAVPAVPTPTTPVQATPVPAVPSPSAPVQATPVLAPTTPVPATQVPTGHPATAPAANDAAGQNIDVIAKGGAATKEIPPYSQELADELIGSFQGAIAPVETSSGYAVSLVLVALFMVLLPLAYFGIIGGIAWMMIRNGPIAIVVGSIFILFLIKPIFFWEKSSPGIRAVTPDQEPLLFSFIQRLCQIVGSPMPKEIQIDCEVNASASFRQGYISMFRSGDLRLTIGLPFVAGLTLRQFTGVLAHEFGHFSQGWGMRLNSFIIRISLWFVKVVYHRDKLDDWMERLSHVDIRIAIFVWFFRLCVWLTRGVLWCLMKLGFIVCGLLMREMEFDADRYEARVAGSQVFEATCRRVQVLSIAYGMAIDDIQDWHMDGRLCDNLPRLIAANIKHLPKKVMEEIDKSIRNGVTALTDTHPADRDRIVSAHAENAPGVFRSAYPATVLFRDFDYSAKGVTWDFFADALGPQLKPTDLHPVDELLAKQEVQIQENKACRRYFHDMFWASRPLRLPSVFVQAPADPNVNVAQITQAREQLVAAKQNTKQLMEKYAEYYSHLKQAHLMVVAHESRTSYDHSDFEFKCSNVHQARDMLNRASQSMNTLTPQIEAFENVAGQRFILALQLLFSERAAGMPDLPQMQQRCQTLMGVLSAMLGHHYMVEKTEIDVYTSHFLFAHFDGDNYKWFEKFKEVMDTVYKSSMAMLQPLMNVEYPFDHALGRMSVSRFIVEKLPAEDDFGEVIDTAMNIIEKLKIIYVRCVSELCMMAEKLESHIGLPVILHDDAAEEEMME